MNSTIDNRQSSMRAIILSGAFSVKSLESKRDDRLAVKTIKHKDAKNEAIYLSLSAQQENLKCGRQQKIVPKEINATAKIAPRVAHTT